MPKCPVCELNFPGVLPDFCSRCVWDIINDPLFIISLDPLPAEVLDAWRQRRELAKSLWKEREQFEAKVLEQRFWKICQENRTIEAWNEYLQKYPHGIYSDETKKIIRQAENEKLEKEQFDQDLADWNSCNENRTVSAIQSYIAHHPTGRFANEARAFLKEFERQQQQKQTEKERLEKDKVSQDQADWEQCKAIRSILAIQGYIDRYPNGAFVAEARKLLRTIQEEQRQQTEKLEKEWAWTSQRQSEWENGKQQKKSSKKSQPKKVRQECIKSRKQLPNWLFVAVAVAVAVIAPIPFGYSKNLLKNYPNLPWLFTLLLLFIGEKFKNVPIKLFAVILSITLFFISGEKAGWLWWLFIVSGSFIFVFSDINKK